MTLRGPHSTFPCPQISQCGALPPSALLVCFQCVSLASPGCSRSSVLSFLRTLLPASCIPPQPSLCRDLSFQPQARLSAGSWGGGAGAGCVWSCEPLTQVARQWLPGACRYHSSHGLQASGRLPSRTFHGRLSDPPKSDLENLQSIPDFIQRARPASIPQAQASPRDPAEKYWGLLCPSHVCSRRARCGPADNQSPVSVSTSSQGLEKTARTFGGNLSSLNVIFTAPAHFSVLWNTVSNLMFLFFFNVCFY